MELILLSLKTVTSLGANMVVLEISLIVCGVLIIALINFVVLKEYSLRNERGRQECKPAETDASGHAYY